MRRRPLLIVVLAGLLPLSSLAGEGPPERLREISRQVAPLHEPLKPPQPGDWLLSHEERGQTFAEWYRSRPVRARGDRRVIYVQPIGPLSKEQRRIVKLSAEFLGHCFGLPAVVREDLPLSVVPDSARREHPSWGMRQLRSTYILDEVLKPRLPADAAALIAFTAIDLFPEPSWNFVFGQASLRDRVGVWSLYRNGDPAKGPAAFRRCLLRTLKTAGHETGHMFSMRHCTAYECGMCGSNNREESDRRPLALCPECLPKVLSATGVDAGARFRQLEAFCRREGLKEEAELYAASLAAITRKPEPASTPR